MKIRTCAGLIGVMATILSAQTAGPADLAWLEGEWQRATRSGTAIERWTRTEAGLVGEAVVARDGREQQTEALLLVVMGGELYYIAKPVENAYPVAFRLLSADDGALVFENTTHDFPQRIVYRRTAPDAMTVTISGPGDDTAPRSIDFEFVRR
ncbi:MAG: DUF6265 family protein [Acidobacteriota bacterium]|jgi:hypothetical protein